MSSISTFTEHTISDTMYQKLVLPRAFDLAFPKKKKEDRESKKESNTGRRKDRKE